MIFTNIVIEILSVTSIFIHVCSRDLLLFMSAMSKGLLAFGVGVNIV